MAGRVPLVFGPVPSRRLGRSLGINDVPPKHCTYSCVYCQVGPTAATETTRRSFQPVAELVEAVRARVSELRDAGAAPDYLTFVPDGEPALDRDLGEAIELLRPLGIPIAVISNGSLAWREEARAALARADWVSFKVDAVDEDIWRRINRPDARLELAQVLDGMLRFARAFTGQLCTETMLLRDLNDGDGCVAEVAAFLERLAPSVAYLAIPTRPPAEPWAASATEERVTAAWRRLSERLPRVELLTGSEGTCFTPSGDAGADLLAITAVHPMRHDAVLALLARAGSDLAVLEHLLEEGSLRRVLHDGRAFYVRRFGGATGAPPLDLVDEAGRESFPASDPPPWWAGGTAG